MDLTMLYKSVFRYFRKRIFQVVLLTMIMVMSAFIFVVMSYSLRALKLPAEAFFESYEQEDFNVTMFEQIIPFDMDNIDPLTKADAVTLSDLYHIDRLSFTRVLQKRMDAFTNRFENTEVETRLNKDVYFSYQNNQHLMRVLKDTNDINRTFVTHGRKPVNQNEIALIEVYARANQLDLGDTMTIHDTTYEITGFVLFPDYTLAIFGTEFILNNQTRTLGLLSDEGFDALSEPLGVMLGGIFKEGVESSSYFNQHNLSFVLNISLTVNTIRSGAIYDEIAGAEAMGLIISLMIASIAVIIVAIMVSRMLFEQRGPIGILKALGYKNKEIALPYMIFVFMLALPGLLIGYFIGLVLAQPMTDLYASIYLLPNNPVEPSWMIFSQSIAVPLAFLMTLGYIVVIKLLKAHPIELMRSPIDKSSDKLSKLPKIFLKFNLLKRIKHAYIWRHKSRLMVFFTGVFTAVFLIFIALSMVNIFDKMFNEYYESIDVNYIAYCEPTLNCEPTDVAFDRVLEIPYVMLQEKSVTVIGLDPENQFHPLFENKKDITNLLSQEGAIITEGIAMELGIKKDDQITLSYGDISITTQVIGIQDELGSSKVYVNRSALSMYLSVGLDQELFNVIYTQQLPNGNYLTVIDVLNLVSQAEDLSNMMIVMTTAMTISAISIGVIVLLLIIILAIEQYNYDISLFKVIGFDNKEIKKIFINIYLHYVIIVFFITLPLALISFNVMMWYMATQYGMIFPMTLSVTQIALALLITIGIFYVATPLVYKKIDTLSLAEALKTYQSVT